MRLLFAALLLLTPVAHAAAAPELTPSQADTETDIRFTLPGNGTVNWDFGDGNTSSQNPALHRYALAGLYTVTYRRGTDSASLAILVRIPAHLYVNGTAGNATARPHLAHESLLVSQPWIIPVLVLVVGSGLLVGARAWLKRRHLAALDPEPELETPPAEPDAPPELDLDAYLPMPDEDVTPSLDGHAEAGASTDVGALTADASDEPTSAPAADADDSSNE